MDQNLLRVQLDHLYDDFSQGRLKDHYTSYFPQLQSLFLNGRLDIKIHALELILNILLIGKWSELHEEEPARPEGMGMVQWRLLQISQRMSARQEVKGEVVLPSKTQQSSDPTKGLEILNWLDMILPQQTEEKVFTVFFIFINTHWEHLKITEEGIYLRLVKLHYRLMELPKYAKLKAFERLNSSFFSSGYRPLS